MVFAPENPNEQRSIGEILDSVDGAICQTKALLAKQQRIKSGLMHDLLIRGLDAQGRLRDPSTHRFKESPVGTIPEEWNSVRLASLVPHGYPITYGVVKPGPGDPNGVKFVRGGDFPEGEILETELRTITKDVSNCYQRTILVGGEVLISLVGEPGACAVVPRRLAGSNIARQVAMIRVKRGINPEYLRAQIASESTQRRLLGEMYGSVQAVINLDRLRQVLVAIPNDEAEQTAIVAAGRLVDSDIRALIIGLGKLRLFRAGLMHDLLTGDMPVTPLLSDSARVIHP
jgi:type I restriction enzyme, S subunit